MKNEIPALIEALFVKVDLAKLNAFIAAVGSTVKERGCNPDLWATLQEMVETVDLIYEDPHAPWIPEAEL